MSFCLGRTTGQAKGTTLDCGGATHRLEHLDNRLVAADHKAEDVNRELALVALGGTSTIPCVNVISAWRSGKRRKGLPKRPRRQRWEIALRHRFADTAGLAILDAAGFDTTNHTG
jgi:hypothetical protein